MSVVTSSMPMMATGTTDNGWGGSGALIAILALAFCGGGFGGGWGRGDHGYSDGDNAELNGRFNSLEDRISDLGNREDLARNLDAVCMTQRDILEAKYDLGNQIAQNRFDDAIGFKDIELRQAECCCSTNANITAAKQEILDKLSANEIKALEAKINDLQRQIPVGTYITYPSNLPIIPPVSAANYGYGGYGFGGCNGF